MFRIPVSREVRNMKAVQINKYGGNEVVEINNKAPRPIVTQGHLLIEVYAAGVNPVDWKIREGYMRQMMPLKFPATLGGDFSGIVAEVGEGVTGFRKGDEIYGQASIIRGGSGSFAEFATADVITTAHKPEALSHIEAAALPLTGVSAWQALVEHIGLSGRKKILIHGGAGGIGSIAIQIAKNLGAYVATTVSVRDMEFAKELGADEAIDYKNLFFDKMLNNYDAVFDTVGGETYTRSFSVLKKGGIIVSMLEQPDSVLMEKYGVKAIGQFTQITSERLSKLAELADKGVIKVHVEKTFRLEAAGGALAFQQNGHPRGKVVLRIKKE